MTINGIDEGNLTKSFDGLRVLDFSTTIAGPHCTRMLADMGAEVIKVEQAEGETMRTRPPVRDHGHSGREFSSGRDAAAETRLRLAAGDQSETDLLFHFRLRPDRSVGRTAGLCACDPRRFRLRHGAFVVPARPRPPGLLRHLPCRRADRGLRVRRDFGGALSG